MDMKWTKFLPFGMKMAASILTFSCESNRNPQKIKRSRICRDRAKKNWPRPPKIHNPGGRRQRAEPIGYISRLRFDEPPKLTNNHKMLRWLRHPSHSQVIASVEVKQPVMPWESAKVLPPPPRCKPAAIIPTPYWPPIRSWDIFEYRTFCDIVIWTWITKVKIWYLGKIWYLEVFR